MYAMVPISEPGYPPPNPLEVSVRYWPTGSATIIWPGLSPARSITAPWPAKIPRVGKVTAVVNPADRADSNLASVVLMRSAAFTQLVVFGRSSGPRAGGLAG